MSDRPEERAPEEPPRGANPLRAEVDEAAARHLPAGAQAPEGFAGKFRVFVELVKFEHSIFALPYAYIGALYGAYALARSAFADTIGDPDPWAVLIGSEYWPRLSTLLWVTVAMVGARSFAFVVNRAVDKEIDARNPRTATRAVPAGLIKAWELWLFALVVLGAYLLAVYMLPPITHVLWPIPLAAFLVYPYTKRFTPLCHYWLGLCLGLAVPGGWAAVTDGVAHPAPWVLGAAVAVWTAGFDMIYATQDIECDVRDGIHSMPADFGVTAALTQTRVLHALTVVLFALGGWYADAGWPYYAGVAVAAALLAYENAIISPKDLSRLNAAFFTTNGVIAIVVLAGVLADRLFVL